MQYNPLLEPDDLTDEQFLEPDDLTDEQCLAIIRSALLWYTANIGYWNNNDYYDLYKMEYDLMWSINSKEAKHEPE